jgi:hypothetical protein
MYPPTREIAARRVELAPHIHDAFVHLLMAIATINVWKRLAIATQQQLPDMPAEP